MRGAAATAAWLVFVMVVSSAAALYYALLAARRFRSDRLMEPDYNARVQTSLLRNRTNPTGLAGRIVERFARQVRPGAYLRPNQRRVSTALGYAGYVGIDKLVIFRLLQLMIALAFGLGGASIAWGRGAFGLEVGLFLAILGYIAPTSVLRRLGRARQARIARELPAILDLLVVSVEAGLSIGESVRLVAREAGRRGGILGGELAVAAAEMGTGVSLTDSLRNLAERSGSEELKALAALIIQSEQMGSRLGPALRASGEQLLARRRARAEERAQRSAVQMLFPLVILILPAMVIVILGPAFIQVIGTLNN
jgi:tight adherence protein C